MKTVCLLLVIGCLAVVLANRLPEDDALLTKQKMNECRKELNIPDPATVSFSTKVPLGENATIGCLMFCMQKKRGLMNEDGTLNKQTVTANIQREMPDQKEAFEKLIENCEKTVKPVEGCKMAACLVPSGPN